MTPSSRAVRTATVACLLLAWTLLTWRLGERGLWADEHATFEMSRGTLADVVDKTMADLHPPLYFVVMNGWTGLAGTSDFSLRWPSAAMALAGVALMPSVARRMMGARAALPATLLLAAAPALIEFGRMARYYSLVMTLGLLSTKLLLDSIEQGGWKRWVAYSASGVAMLYTFYPSGVLLALQGILALLRRRAASRSWAIAAACGTIVFAPWFAAVAARQAVGVSGSLGADFAHSLIGVALGIGMSVYTFGVGETLFPWQPEAWVGGALIALLLRLALRGSQRRGARQAVWIALACIIFMSLVTTFVSVNTPFINVPVRALFALPFFLMPIASGLACLRDPRQRVVLAGVLLGAWALGEWNYFAGRQFLNPIYLTPAKEAAALVRQAAREDDLVISDIDSVFDYYFPAGGAMPQHRYTERVDEVASALAALNPPRVWLVTLGRDRTQRGSTADVVQGMLLEHYPQREAACLLAIDPTYADIKRALLGRDTYDCRLTVERYER